MLETTSKLIPHQRDDPAKPADGRRNLGIRSEIVGRGDFEKQTEADKRKCEDVATNHPFAMLVDVTLYDCEHGFASGG